MTPYFFGVDQTGALATQNRYRPLHSAWIVNHRLHLGVLRSLSDSEIAAKIGDFGFKKNDTQIYLVIDAALGLPRAHHKNLTIRELIERAGLSLKKNLKGLKAGVQFYRELELEVGPFYSMLRSCEQEYQAQSVLSAYPSQRNIQTGTFRFLQDLSLWDSSELGFFHYDSKSILKKRRIWIAEGYAASFHRKKVSLKDAFHSYGISIGRQEWMLIQSNPNVKDAAVLALISFQCFGQGQIVFPKRKKKNQQEGGICIFV